MKEKIEKSLELMKKENYNRLEKLNKIKNLDEYKYCINEKGGYKIWTKALNTALCEAETVVIPESAEPYYIDDSIIMHSGNRIIAYGAVIKQIPGTKVLMLRNENPIDETDYPAKEQKKDENLSVFGGTWEEMCSSRAGYGSSGMIDEKRSMFGVSTAFLFSNVSCVTLTDVTFVHTGGFAVQTGNADNVVFENIRFKECFADGLHINGNSKNILARNIKGNVGDDIIALNMYDWHNSSINFGPGFNIMCEDIELDKDGDYKAIRIENGVYTFKDGTSVDCGISNLIMRKVRGIKTFKLYLQTIPYKISDPTIIGVGSGDNLYFEDIDIDLDSPIDELDNYMKSDRVTGSIAGFELGSNIGHMYLDNIKFTHHREKYPMSFLICVGPKSSLINGDMEIFDPYVECSIDMIKCSNITINGERTEDVSNFVHCIEFNQLYESNYSSGYGKIKELK